MKLFSYIALLAFALGCGQSPQFIDYKNKHIEYMGRIAYTDTSGAEIYWSGTSLKINFKGTNVKALLKDEKGDNFFNVIIDDGPAVILRPDSSKALYTLADGLEYGDHSVQLYKRTQWHLGSTRFYGFQLGDGTELLPRSAPKKRKIEFYGNSITAATALKDTSGLNSDSMYTNNYASYASRTARHFDAEYSFIVRSGIGITVSWMPIVMPEIYDRLDPRDPQSRWDFSKFKAEIVVINLFQNDSWLVKLPEHKEFKARFGIQNPNAEFFIKAYSDFVRSIRARYPEAKIICMLGNMDITRAGSPWPDYVQKAVQSLNDPGIYSYFAPYKNTPGHPTVAEHKVLAEGLITFIEQTLGW